MAASQATTKAARLKYIRMWKVVKKDPLLKKPPSYFALAKCKGVRTSHLKSPRERSMLSELSTRENLMDNNAIINLTKSSGRCQFRRDGVVPCLGYGCGSFFVPSKGMYLSGSHLLALTGFCPIKDKDVYKRAQGIAKHDLEVMIGNAMSLPVIGAVIAGALCMVRA